MIGTVFGDKHSHWITVAVISFVYDLRMILLKLKLMGLPLSILVAGCAALQKETHSR